MSELTGCWIKPRGRRKYLVYGGLYLPNATFKRFAETDLDATTTTNGTPTNYQHPTIGPDRAPLFNEINKYKAR